MPIVSNATESSYVLDAHDQLDSAPPDGLAAKLTQVLWARFQAGEIVFARESRQRIFTLPAWARPTRTYTVRCG